MKLIDPRTRAFIVLLALLNALGALGIDMALPANGQTALALGVDSERLSWSLSLFLAGFALSPLLAGPLSDRFGRRPVLLVGLAMFAVASVGCALSDSLSALLAWRLLQGLGGGAGRPVILAIVRDCFEGSEARSKLSFMAALGMLAPLVAPSLGSLVLSLGDWRVLYGVLALYGLLSCVLVHRGYAESLAVPLPHLNLRTLIGGYREAFAQPRFLAGTLVTTASFGSIFAYVSASPGLFIETLGLSTGQYGLIFGACSAGLITGALLNGQLNARHFDPRHLLLAGAALALAGGLGLTGSAVFKLDSIWPWLGSIVLLTLSGGLVTGNATQMALEPFRQHAGSASASMSALQMVGASLAGAGVGLCAGLSHGSAMALVCVACEAVMLGAITWLLGQERERASAEPTRQLHE